MRTRTRRFFAVALMGGGAAGFALFVALAIRISDAGALSWPNWPFAVLWIALFVWAVFTGLRLWQGTPYGLRWAKVIFACQVPMLTIPGFQYVWFTGVNVGPALEKFGPTIRIVFNLEAGGSGYLLIGPGVTATEIGINLFAVVALVCLLRSGKRQVEPDSVLPPEDAAP